MKQNNSRGHYRPRVSEECVVYAVVVGSKVEGVYRYKDDAKEHASVTGGVVITASVKDEVPQWVSTMVAAAKDKARMQGGSR